MHNTYLAPMKKREGEEIKIEMLGDT